MPIQRVELHGHSMFSMLDGLGTPTQIAERVVELGQKACAQTDHGNCYGHVPWQKAAKNAGIKPIFGCEFYIAEDSEEKTRYNETLGVDALPHITIIARTQEGYENFLRLIEISYERFYYRPRIDKHLIHKYQKGLTILTGCPTGWPTRYIDAGKDEEAYNFIKELRDRCERVYVETVMQPGYAPAEKAAYKLSSIANELGMEVVATSDAHFPRPEDSQAQDLMVHIGLKVPVGQRKAVNIPKYQFYSSGETLFERGRLMYDACKELYGGQDVSDEWIIEAIERSVKVADECEVEITKAKSVAFPHDGTKTSEQLLTELAYEGYQKRIDAGRIDVSRDTEYRERIQRELDLISSKGFADYMLAVADICNWVKSQDSLVMCRGSAGGSLLLFVTGASETDSILHDLSFERFYDFTRPDPPDVDMDFETWFRPKVIEYVTNKYGTEHCAQVMALALFRAKNAVTDVAQAYNIPRKEYEALIMSVDSKDDDLDGQMDEFTDPEVMKVIAKHPKLRIAQKIIGQIRQGTTHACGMVVSAEPLHKYVAVIRQPNKSPVVSADRSAVAEIGLLKFDFLSVSSFDALANMVRLAGLKMSDLYNLPFDDKEVFETAKRGEIVGIFQLDGAAYQVGRKIGLDRFEELYAASALCRPGACDFVDLYAQNKFSGGKFEEYMNKYSDSAQQIIGKTFGVVLYQEQMMQFARQHGGYEWVDVHKLRKRIATASFIGFELGAEWEDPYMEGCIRNGISKEEAVTWWSAIKKHGIYSFNKSHCVTYAIVSYWMLWMKTYYPDAFYEAYLAQEGHNGKNMTLMKRLIIEWRKKGGKIQLISKSKPSVSFKSVGNKTICGGWSNLSGLGEKGAEIVVANGPYDRWAELQYVLPKNIYGKLIETGLTGEMTKNTGRLLNIAPWFPVQHTQDHIKKQIDPMRSIHDIYSPGDMVINGVSARDIKIAGYVSTRFVKPRTGSFKGEQIIYSLEDERGIVTMRVGSKHKELQIKVKAAFEVGDYVVVKGWWSGDGTLFIADFVPVSKWNEVV